MKMPFAFIGTRSKFRRRTLTPFVLLGAAAFVLCGARHVSAEKVYSFGVVPQQSATRLAEVWVPFLDKLGEKAGFKLKFTTAKDIPTFEACLAAQAYDFAYMNPYHFVVVHETAGYQAFAHEAGRKLRGILVTQADSAIQELSDLNNQEVAFPSPAAFGASVIPRAELTKQGVSFTPRYVKSHDSVYRAVALGLVPAGGGVQRTFGNIPEELRARLRVFYRTDEYTPHAFAAAPGVPANVRANISIAMREMSDQQVLAPLGMSGFTAADSDAWDDVRALGLTSRQTDIASEGDQACHSN